MANVERKQRDLITAMETYNYGGETQENAGGCWAAAATAVW